MTSALVDPFRYKHKQKTQTNQSTWATAWSVQQPMTYRFYVVATKQVENQTNSSGRRQYIRLVWLKRLNLRFRVLIGWPFWFAGNFAASLLSVAVGQPPGGPSDRGGASENSQANRLDTASAGRTVRRVQEVARMRYLYDWVQCWRFGPLFAVHAHLPR